MLRQVYIIINEEIVYNRYYAQSLEKSVFNDVLENIKEEIFSKFSTDFGNFEFFKWKLSYIVEKDLKLIFIFVSDLTDDFDRIKLELFKLKREFLDVFDNLKIDYTNKTNFEMINPFIDNIHKNLKPKISLVGFSGVGKTTITKLIRSEEIPMIHIPTITGEVSVIKIGRLFFNLWDFAGQEQFNFLWNKFIKGSDAVLLISDSTLENIEKSKFFVNLISEQAPYAHAAIIANKQDTEEALNVEKIENIMGLKAYSMIAIDPENKNKMIQIIADILDIKNDISPLLKPLYERDKLILEVQNALEQENFEQSIILFEKIAELCIEIGDDSVANEFYEKSEYIKKVLNL